MTLPAWVAPQLATLVSGPPPGDDWVHEIKLDGYRILLRIERGRVMLLTRNRQDWTTRFPAVAEAAAALPVKEALLDGEIVVLDRAGVSSFQALQQADQLERGRALVYVAFDLLFLDGRDLRPLPLVERKARLAGLLTGRRGRLRYSEHFDVPGPRVYERACRLGLEGIIAKQKNAPYTSGRGQAWLKVKCVARQELVIGGYTDPDGARASSARCSWACTIATGGSSTPAASAPGSIAPRSRASARGCGSSSGAPPRSRPTARGRPRAARTG